MIEEALGPFVGKLERYLRLGMGEEAMLCCVGLLEGIYLFGTESKTEFREWAADDSLEAFGWVFEIWKKTTPEERLRERMAEELRDRCPSWPTPIR